MEKVNKRRNTILRILQERHEEATSRVLTQLMGEMGFDVSDRTVRMDITVLQKLGLVESNGRKGCVITSAGMDAIKSSQISSGIGYLSAKIDQMTYRMTFDLPRRTGTVVLNFCIVQRKIFAQYLPLICEVFAQGYAMGRMVSLVGGGQRFQDQYISDDCIGFCTVCSITLNGVLLKHGVPTVSRFGGLLDVHKGKPLRFAEIIHYDGTSIGPLEVFIRSGMTDYMGAVTSEKGRVGASFREIPADSIELVRRLEQRLHDIGLGGFMKIGHGGQTILETPVSEGRAGALIIGGLNPIAILEENGHRTQSFALHSLLDYSELFDYTQLPSKLAGLS